LAWQLNITSSEGLYLSVPQTQDGRELLESGAHRCPFSIREGPAGTQFDRGAGGGLNFGSTPVVATVTGGHSGSRKKAH